jgi:hypothetical protein
VYVGIFAVQEGLGDQIGGTVTSMVSFGAFFAPLMLAWMQRHSVRHAVRTGFMMSGAFFLLAALCSSSSFITMPVRAASHPVFLILSLRFAN